MSTSGGKSKGPGGRDPVKLFDKFNKRLDPYQNELVNYTEQLIAGINNPGKSGPQLGGGNPYTQNITASPYYQQSANYLEQTANSVGQIGSSIEADLARARSAAVNQAGVSTENSTRAALLAARSAGGARGGLAYGGGASALAASVGAQAASQTGAALTSALAGIEGQRAGLNLGAQQARAQGRAGISEGYAGLAGIQSNAASQQAQIFQQNQQFQTEALLTPRQRYIELLAGIGSAGVSGSGGSPSIRSRSKNGSMSK